MNRRQLLLGMFAAPIAFPRPLPIQPTRLVAMHPAHAAPYGLGFGPEERRYFLAVDPAVGEDYGCEALYSLDESGAIHILDVRYT